jgi:beta-fructofuranosidase
VRYWFAQEFFGEYHTFHNNVVLPNGNYAARTVQDGEHLLVFNFFYTQGRVDLLRVLPPPKQLDTDEKGRLLLRSFYKWELMVIKIIEQKDMPELRRFFNNKTASFNRDDGKWICGSRSGYEIFYFERPSSSFIWEGQINVEGMGKLGLVSDVDKDGSGYYFSFDVNNGVVRIRAWGYNPSNDRQDFIFNDIQANVFSVKQTSFHFRLIRYGNYIELAIDDVVKLTLMDYTYSASKMGLYSASSVISLEQSVIKILPDPEEEYSDPTEIQKLL